MTCINILGTRLEIRSIPAPLHAPARAPIVFLHEGLGSVSQWGQQGSYWPERVCQATGRAGLVYSRRGYGESDPVPDVRGAGRLAADYMHHEAWVVLPALLQALGLHQPVLLGHSDGGTIALLHASRHAVAACIAMAPHVMVEPICVEVIARLAAEYTATAHEPKGLRARLSRYHRDVDCAFWQWNDVWLSDAFRSFDIRPQCRSITAPLLAVQGQQDPYGTLAQIEDIRRAAPQTRLLTLQACGHSPHRDQPEPVLKAVADFLSSLTDSA